MRSIDLGLVSVLAGDPNDPCVRHQRRDVVDLASVSGVQLGEECGRAHGREHAADVGFVPDAIDLERDVRGGGGSTELPVPDRRLRRHGVVIQRRQIANKASVPQCVFGDLSCALEVLAAHSPTDSRAPTASGLRRDPTRTSAPDPARSRRTGRSPLPLAVASRPPQRRTPMHRGPHADRSRGSPDRTADVAARLAGPSPIQEDQPRELREAAEEARPQRVLPHGVDVAEVVELPDEVYWTVADDLVGDVHPVVGLHVPGARGLHLSSPPGRGATGRGRPSARARRRPRTRGRSGDEILHGLGDQHLGRPGEGADPRADVHGDAAARRRPSSSTSPVCRPARISSPSGRTASAIACGAPHARAGPSNVARNPSPAVLISRPR